MTRLDDLRLKRLLQPPAGNDPYGTQAFLAALDLKLGRMARAAELRLDAMVDAGNKRQRVRQLRWYLKFLSHTTKTTRSYEEQSRLHEQWKLRGAVEAVAGYSYHEKALALDTELFQ